MMEDWFKEIGEVVVDESVEVEVQAFADDQFIIGIEPSAKKIETASGAVLEV